MRRILIMLVLVVLTGCAGGPVDDRRAAAELYDSARSAIDRGDYRTAVETYETLQTRYPFGVFADQAQLDIIYAYNELDEPDSAIAAAERFLRLNPRHERAPYAWYMRGVVEQERGENAITRTLDLNRARRDPEPLERAFDTFGQLIERFPDSEYNEDARRRMQTIRRDLAEHDLIVARFYRERGAWVAAANRATRVIERYPGTPAVEGALQLLSEAYDSLELKPLKADVERILEMNDISPGNPGDA